LIKWRAQQLFAEIQDGLEELAEPSRAYNDLEFMRNYSATEFDVIMPRGLMSQVNKHDVPFLFREDTKPTVKEVDWKYFGTVLTSGGTSDGSKRALVEKDFVDASAVLVKHCFPGELIPNTGVYAAYEAYTPQYTSKPSLSTTGVEIYLIHKNDYPIMSGFVVGTNFYDPQALITNHYLTFGHNPVRTSHLREYALLKFTTSITPPEPAGE
jgi:hypothetical protein